MLYPTELRAQRDEISGAAGSVQVQARRVHLVATLQFQILEKVSSSWTVNLSETSLPRQIPETLLMFLPVFPSAKSIINFWPGFLRFSLFGTRTDAVAARRRARLLQQRGNPFSQSSF
jgi:hypothetical protein